MWRSPASPRSDDETVPGGVDDREGHEVQVVHAENALDLSEEACQ